MLIRTKELFSKVMFFQNNKLRYEKKMKFLKQNEKSCKKLKEKFYFINLYLFGNRAFTQKKM